MKKFLLTILTLVFCWGFYGLAFSDTTTITDERQAVTDGKMFFATHSFLAATQNFWIKSGTTAPRLQISLSSSGQSAICVGAQLFESSSSYTTTGTAITPFNSNRNYTAIASKMVVGYSPSHGSLHAANGSAILTKNVNCGASPVSVEMFTPAGGVILKKSTAYHFEVTPSSAVYTVTVELRWKE